MELARHVQASPTANWRPHQHATNDVRNPCTDREPVLNTGSCLPATPSCCHWSADCRSWAAGPRAVSSSDTPELFIMGFNVFHILGDVSHTSSKLILIWAIHSNSSAEGPTTPKRLRVVADARKRCLAHYASSVCPRILHTLSRHIYFFCDQRWLAYMELYAQGGQSGLRKGLRG